METTKAKNKAEQNKIHSSDLKLCLGSRRIKRKLQQMIVNKPIVEMSKHKLKIKNKSNCCELLFISSGCVSSSHT